MANEFKIKNGLVVSGSADIQQDLTVHGTITADQLNISIVSSSVMYESGSTKFGDSVDDNHSFTGSISITGSIDLNGQAIGTGKLDETEFYSFTSSYISDSGSINTRIGDLESFSSSLDSNFVTEGEFGTYTGSMNSFTSSTLSTINALNNASQSIRGDFNSFTSSYTNVSSSIDSRIDSLELFSSSLDNTFLSDSEFNSYTSSVNPRLNAIETSTGSLNSFTSSINTTIKSKLDSENVISGSIQVQLTGTTGYSTFSSSIATSTNDLSGSINSLSTSIAITDLNQDNKLNSIETSTGSLNTFTSSASGRLTSLESASSSIITDLNTYTSSNNSTNTTQNNRLDSLESTTASLNLFTSSITTVIDDTINNGTLISGSIQVQLTGTTGYSTFSSSIATTTSNLSTDITNLSTSIAVTDLNQNGRLTSIESKTGSYATTGSNVFIGQETISGSISLSPTNVTINNNLSSSYIYSSGSEGLYFTQNYNGLTTNTELRWLEGNLYTGLLHGGVISATVGGTTFNISEGKGIIVTLNATTTSSPQPTIVEVEWGAFTGQTITNIGTSIQTFLGIDSTGAIIQQTTPFTSGQFNNSLSLGTVLHQNLSTVNGSTNYPNVAYGYKQRTYDFVKAFGPLKLSGLELFASGSSTGSLIVSTGTAYAEGRNYNVDPNNPSYITDSGTNVSKIFRYHQVSGTTFVQDTNGGAGYTSIDSLQYNNSGTLTTVPDNEWTTQRIFWFPNSSTKAILVYYGNKTYTTSAEAIANLPYEAFTEVANTQQNAVYLGALVVKKNADFTDTSTYQILPGGLFRNLGGTGGGGTTVTNRLSDLSDVTVSGATNGQLFVYNSSLDKWYGSSNITASLFGNASTATKLQSSRTINGTSFDGTQDIVIPNLVSGSNQISYTGLTNIPSGIVSGSSQIDLTSTTNYSSGIKTRLDAEGVVSGSSQISFGSITGIPSGIVSGSSQVSYTGLSNVPSGIVSGSSQISFGSITGVPSGLVSGSSQVLNGSGVWSGSAQLPSGIVSGSSQILNGSGIVSGSSQISFGGLNGLPSGIVSGSSQVSFSGISGVPSGLVSGSSQVLEGTGIHSGSFFNGISVVSGSAQISFGSITGVPSGLVSGSGQISLASTGGFGTYLNQAVLTSSSPSFSTVTATTFTGALSGNATSATSATTATFATNSSKLYSTDTAYAYGSASPYYGYLTYDGTYWQFKVSPATPENVRVYTADRLGGYSFTTSSTANTIVQRDSNGYITNSYFYTSGGGAERNASGISYFAGFNSSDYYVRSYTVAAVQSALGLGTAAYQSANQALNTSSSPTFADVYTGGWFRNNNTNQGLYNQANANHFYSTGGSEWVVAGNSSSSSIALLFRATHQSTLRGYVYADTSSNFGFLDNTGNWQVRCNPSNSGGQLYNGWTISGNFLPTANNSYNLGSATYGWANVYTNDLHLSNMNKPEGNDVDGTNGTWTIQEGEENLYIINNRNKKKFKISLEEII